MINGDHYGGKYFLGQQCASTLIDLSKFPTALTVVAVWLHALPTVSNQFDLAPEFLGPATSEGGIIDTL